MKHSSLPVKRRSVKKGALRTLYANIAGKRHRAAVASMHSPMPEAEGSVPNIGVARALIVILAIHVIAIAGIFIHSHFFEQRENAVATGPKLLAPATTPRVDEDAYKLPKIGENDKPYPVGTGDSYASIALAQGVDEHELREVNGDIRLSPSVILKLPPKRITADQPDQAAMLRQVGNSTNAGHAVLPPDSLREVPPMVEANRVATRSAVVHSDDSVLVRPTIRREGGEASTKPKEKEVKAPKATPVAESNTPSKPEAKTAARSTSFKSSYTVKSGDTFWRISQAHGTTPQALMKANGIKDASKLKIGMQLKVPAKQ